MIATSGIYEIKNTLTNQRYIGSSVNIHSRWKLHLYQLKRNKHHSIYLQRVWNKYGEKHFEFNILETCEPIKETLILLEQKYIDGLKPEYNSSITAGSPLGCKRSKKFKNNLSTLWKSNKNVFNKRIPVIMLDLETMEELREFNSIKEAADFLGNSNLKNNIGLVARGKRHKASGYKWKFKSN